MRSYQITSRKRLDLSPVFGRLEREQEDRVLGHLHVAHERLQALMRAFAKRTGSQWTSGVELQLFGLGQACICGSVETPPGAAFELTCEVELRPCNFYDDDPAAGTLGWTPKPRVMATGRLGC